MEQNNQIKWEVVATASIEDRTRFWCAISLSVLKPHLINRRLAGAEQICAFRSSDTGLNSNGIFINRMVNYIESQKDEEVGEDFLKDAIRQSGIQDEIELMDVQDLSQCDLSTEQQILIILSKLLPKNLTSHKCTFEINILGEKMVFEKTNLFNTISIGFNFGFFKFRQWKQSSSLLEFASKSNEWIHQEIHGGIENQCKYGNYFYDTEYN